MAAVDFRQRYWRRAWDGISPDDSMAKDHMPAVLPWFTFHEGRHTHATWLAEDGVPEVARHVRKARAVGGTRVRSSRRAPARRVGQRPSEHEKLTGAYDENWPDRYAAYLIAEQNCAELPV